MSLKKFDSVKKIISYILIEWIYDISQTSLLNYLLMLWGFLDFNVKGKKEDFFNWIQTYFKENNWLKKYKVFMNII